MISCSFGHTLVFQVGLQILEEETMMTKEPRDWATIDASIAIGDKVKHWKKILILTTVDLLGDGACDADGPTEEGALPLHCGLALWPHSTSGKCSVSVAD